MTEYRELTDEVLVQMVSKGDTQAMDYLLNQYKNLVRQKARTLFLVGADKEDLIQEGMIGLYKAIRDYDATKEASFRHFAELCIARQMYTAIKTSNTKKNQPLNNYISFDSFAAEETSKTGNPGIYEPILEKISNPEEIVIDKENADVLECTLVGHLSNLERRVLKYYLQDYNYGQIAAILGKETKAVDNAIQRIKKKLTQVLAELSV